MKRKIVTMKKIRHPPFQSPDNHFTVATDHNILHPAVQSVVSHSRIQRLIKSYFFLCRVIDFNAIFNIYPVNNIPS